VEKKRLLLKLPLKLHRLQLLLLRLLLLPALLQHQLLRLLLLLLVSNSVVDINL
jgi:hypothetical protein